MKHLFPSTLVLLIALISCGTSPHGDSARELGVLDFDARGPHDLVQGPWKIEGKYVAASGKVADFWFVVPDGNHESTISHLLSECINLSAEEECTRPLSCPDGPDYLSGDGQVTELMMHRPNKGDAIDTLTVNFFDR